jgi:hypothetical protein
MRRPPPRSIITCSCARIAMTPSATENNFRSNLSQFRWARGVNDDSQPSDAGASRNPFSRFYNAVGGAYVPLRSSERSNEEEAYFALSRWERFGQFHHFFFCPRAQTSVLVDCLVFSPASPVPQFASVSHFSRFRYSPFVRQSLRSPLG